MRRETNANQKPATLIKLDSILTFMHEVKLFKNGSTQKNIIHLSE